MLWKSRNGEFTYLGSKIKPEDLANIVPTVIFVMCLLVGAVAVTLFYQLRLRKYRQANLLGAWATLGVSLVCGFLLSKVTYVLTTFEFDNLLKLSPGFFSVWGGAAGVCIAVIVTAPLCHVKPMQALDAFAPCGALMLCFTRLAEYFMNPSLIARNITKVGTSTALTPILENGVIGIFPGTWHVCFMEAAIALAIMAIALFVKKNCFLRTAFWLMAIQLFTEELHGHALKLARLGLVKVGLILCALSLLGILILHGRRGRKLTAWQRQWPNLFFLLPAGIIVFASFELDKYWINNFLVEHYADAETGVMAGLPDVLFRAHNVIWYAMILLSALGMILLECIMVRRRSEDSIY